MGTVSEIIDFDSAPNAKRNENRDNETINNFHVSKINVEKSQKFDFSFKFILFAINKLSLSRVKTSP